MVQVENDAFTLTQDADFTITEDAMETAMETEEKICGGVHHVFRTPDKGVFSKKV